MPAILAAAKEAGAKWAGFVVLRLPWAVAPLFEQWLEEHFPDRKDKVLNRIRDLRGGKLYDAQWGVRGRGTGIFADQIAGAVRRHLPQARAERRALGAVDGGVPETDGAGVVVLKW